MNHTFEELVLESYLIDIDGWKRLWHDHLATMEHATWHGVVDSAPSLIQRFFAAIENGIDLDTECNVIVKKCGQPKFAMAHVDGDGNVYYTIDRTRCPRDCESRHRVGGRDACGYKLRETEVEKS